MGMEQNFKLAVKSLMSSKARAILTMLGIIIGVAAVIIITSLGNGMQTMMNEQFEKIGTNLVQVSVWGRGPGSSRTAEPDGRTGSSVSGCTFRRYALYQCEHQRPQRHGEV